MNENSKPLRLVGLWRQLLYNGVAIGTLLGLLEVCCAYLLPSLFPDRHYELPIATIGWFVLIAIVVDTFLVLVAVTILGGLITIFHKLWRSEHTFHHWPTLIRFVLVAGMLSYPYLGLVHFYYEIKQKLLAEIIGVVVIILISAAVAWLLRTMQRRLGKVSAMMVWIFAFVVLACMVVPNYLLYRSENTVKMSLPTGDIEQPANVLLVTLDTLRADHVGCYGNRIVQTPVLDALAADACLFERAYAQSPTTTPSHCSIMTSVYSAQHGAFNGSAMKLGFPTLADIFQNNGYETVAFVSAFTTRSSHSGLHKGFNYYEDSLSPYTTVLRHDELQLLLVSRFLMSLQESQIPGFIVSDRALAWLDKKKNSPFFCWLHYFDPHYTYDAPKPYKDMYDGKIDPNMPKVSARSRYAGEVTYVDAQLGRFIEGLKRKGFYDSTLIIVTSDHGEAFHEKHGNITEYSHGDYLYDTTQHVPLIIKLPGNEGFGGRVKNIVQLIDLAPTVLDYLCISLPDTFEGISLLGLLNGEQRSEPGTTYAECKGLFGRRRQLASIRTHEFKYIHDFTREQQELYEVLIDSAEVVNVYSGNLELAKSCYQRIQETLGKPVETGVTSLDPRVLDQLKSLGYVDDGPSAEE